MDRNDDEIKLFQFLNLKGVRTGMQISSLQAFETALFMGMHDRWVAAIIASVNSIETALRLKFGSEHDLIHLISLAQNDGLLSGQLSDRAHELRKKRNQFTHNKISPADNPESAKDFFTKVIPVCRKLFDGIFFFDLQNSFLNTDLWFVLHRMRGAMKGMKSSRSVSHSTTCETSVFRKTISNEIYYEISPQWVRSRLEQLERDHNALLQPKILIESQSFVMDQAELELLNSYIGEGLDIPCPAYPCKGDMMLMSDPECMSRNPFDFIFYAECPLCSLKISDDPQLEAFIFPLVTDTWIIFQLEERGYSANYHRSMYHLLEGMGYRLTIPHVHEGYKNVDGLPVGDQVQAAWEKCFRDMGAALPQLYKTGPFVLD